MGLILIPLKSVAKLQLSSTVEGLVPIWHQFQHQKSPCWRLPGVYWQTGLSSKKMKFIRTEVLPWIIPVLTRCPSRDCLLDDISQLKIMEITKSTVVCEFTQVPGLEAQGPWAEEQPLEIWKDTYIFLGGSHWVFGHAESPLLLLLLIGKPLCLCEYSCPCAQRQKILVLAGEVWAALCWVAARARG